MTTTLSRRATEYESARDRLASTVRDAPSGARVRLAKQTSNLFRFRSPNPGIALDARPFARVLDVYPSARIAEVGGMTTYEDLVNATLVHGLMPLVVPQLKTITLGGAVSGVGIESSSFRNGLPHESVLEAEIVTGAGEVVVATPDGPHADLFHGLPNSYGTLGYATRLRIELMPVRPFVRLRHERFDSAKEVAGAIADLAASGAGSPAGADFVDGVAFAPDELYLTFGSFADEAPSASDYTGQRIYYRSIRERDEDVLTTHDYIWRWDTDWFWCSRAFGLQRPMIRRLWPQRYRRSDVYRRLIALDDRIGLSRRLDSVRGRPQSERVIQDVQIPVDRLADFLEFLDQQTGQRPVWLCPFRTRDGKTTWPLFPLDPRMTYINVGFWGTAPLPNGAYDGFHNRAIERTVAQVGGAKSLYSTSYYDPETFHELYGGETYRDLKDRYDPQRRLLDLFDKTVRAQ